MAGESAAAKSAERTSIVKKRGCYTDGSQAQGFSRRSCGPTAYGRVRILSGQRPSVRRARKSVAAFKVRQGQPIGAAATLRGERMWDFLDRLMNIALPRVRDFRGVSPNSFDGRGNYSLGLREQLVFPEIDYDEIKKIQGMNVSIVTTAETDEEARELLRLLGMPFAQ